MGPLGYGIIARTLVRCGGAEGREDLTGANTLQPSYKGGLAGEDILGGAWRI